MKLTRLTDRVWIYPYESECDRPNLCYIRGDRWSIAADAGHSGDHTKDFYKDLEEADLPLPRITVLTHWHWDHTFGMHAVNGLCIANELTNRYLDDFRKKLDREGPGFFFGMDETIRREYKGEKPVIVTLADIVFSGEMLLDPGNCPVRIFQAESPHTDDATLIDVINEKVLILGDAISGTFPDYQNIDPVNAGKLADTIRQAAPDICVHGHLEPLPPEEMIREIISL